MKWTIFSNDNRHGPTRDLSGDQQSEIFQALQDPTAYNREDLINLAQRAGLINSGNSISVEGEWIDGEYFATTGSADFWRDILG